MIEIWNDMLAFIGYYNMKCKWKHEDELPITFKKKMDEWVMRLREVVPP